MISDGAKASLGRLVTEVKELATKEKKRLNTELTMLKAVQSGCGMDKVRQHVRDQSLTAVNSSVSSYLV